MPLINPKRGGDNLRARREAAGLTRQQLAQRAGCSMSAVGLLEGGYSPSRSDVLARIEQALTKDELEGGDAKAEAEPAVPAAP